MIRSMTGFGDASHQRDGASWFVEVRSLNNKYFKANIRLPEELQGLEAEIESELRRRLSRGSVTLIANCTQTSEDAAFTVNHRALEKYIEQIRRAPAVAQGLVALDAATLLQLPGVLQPPADEEARLDKGRAALAPLVARAVDGLIEMRTREGQMLRDELMRQHDLIRANLEEIRRLAPRVVGEYEQRLHQRIRTLLDQANLRAEPADVIREIAVYAEKTDIHEEVTRLDEHLRHFADLLSKQDESPVGRTLDFLTQELLREANTIASKSPDATISRLIVEIKGAIDRIKEQAQNVE